MKNKYNIVQPRGDIDTSICEKWDVDVRREREKCNAKGIDIAMVTTLPKGVKKESEYVRGRVWVCEGEKGEKGDRASKSVCTASILLITEREEREKRERESER